MFRVRIKVRVRLRQGFEAPAMSRVATKELRAVPRGLVNQPSPWGSATEG